MFDKIKRLGTDTAIYGVSTILGRFLNFLLVPFYTNVLHPSDYRSEERRVGKECRL